MEEEQYGEARAAYGEGIIKQLLKDLSREIGKGFSVANLENFRKFYLTFSDKQKTYAVRRELSWTHYRLIMRIEDPAARMYQNSDKVLAKDFIKDPYVFKFLNIPEI